MRGKLVDTGALCRRWDDFPADFGVMPSPHTLPALLMARKTRPSVTQRTVRPEESVDFEVTESAVRCGRHLAGRSLTEPADCLPIL